MTSMTIPGQSHARSTDIGLVHNDRSLLVGATYPDQEELGDFSATTGWTALNTDTTGLATHANHIIGTNSMEFDKVDGAANTVFGAIQRTPSPALDLSRFGANDELQSYFTVSDVTNIAYAFVRLGTDASNYNEWRLSDASITINIWQAFPIALAGCQIAVVGNGWNPAVVTWVCVGIAFDAEANALANIRWDCLRIYSSRHTRT